MLYEVAVLTAFQVIVADVVVDVPAMLVGASGQLSGKLVVPSGTGQKVIVQLLPVATSWLPHQSSYG